MENSKTKGFSPKTKGRVIMALALRHWLLWISLLAACSQARLISLFAVSRHSLKSIDYTSSFAELFDAQLQMTPGAAPALVPHLLP